MLRTRLLSLVVLAVAAGALVEADEVIIKGKEKEKPLKGKVTKESPKEITLAPAKEPIPTESIADIVYECPPGGASIAYNAAVKAEQASLDPTKEKDRAAKLKEAIDKYE